MTGSAHEVIGLRRMRGLMGGGVSDGMIYDELMMVTGKVGMLR